MEGRFESFTVGRNISMERVKEVYRLFKKHGFRLADLRSFGHRLSDEDFAEKRRLAAELEADPEHFARVRDEAAARLREIPVAAKGVKASGGNGAKWALAGGAGLLALGLLKRRRRRSRGRV